MSDNNYVRDFIDAIDAGDNINAQSNFNSEMSTRISDALQTKRMEVAKSFVNSSDIQEAKDDLGFKITKAFTDKDHQKADDWAEKIEDNKANISKTPTQFLLYLYFHNMGYGGSGSGKLHPLTVLIGKELKKRKVNPVSDDDGMKYFESFDPIQEAKYRPKKIRKKGKPESDWQKNMENYLAGQGGSSTLAIYNSDGTITLEVKPSTKFGVPAINLVDGLVKSRVKGLTHNRETYDKIKHKDDDGNTWEFNAIGSGGNEMYKITIKPPKS